MSTLIFEPEANVPSELSVMLPWAPPMVMIASFGAGRLASSTSRHPSRSLLATPARCSPRV
jgi:hypothetical protein